MYVCMFSILSLGDCGGRKQVRGECKVERWINSLDELLIIPPNGINENYKLEHITKLDSCCWRCLAQKYYSMIMEFFTFLCRISFSTDGNHTPARVGSTSYEKGVYQIHITARHLTEYIYFVIIWTLRHININKRLFNDMPIEFLYLYMKPI